MVATSINGNQRAIYPQKKKGENFNTHAEPCMILSHTKKSASIFCRRLDSGDNRQLVQFTGLTKEGVQELINELQNMHDNMESSTESSIRLITPQGVL